MIFMDYFLEKIARSLYSEYGNTLNRHCLVFPNRRAGLYFLKYLAAGISKPVWVPAIYTINELFRSYSSSHVASGEILLFELYKIYTRIGNSHETFDEFCFWGDMILDDFDDVDKYLVNAELLFRNLSDIKDIDQKFGRYTDGQIEIIRRFWVNFNPEKPTREKSEFVSLWSLLHRLYCGLRESLTDQNLAYEGMIFREMAENRKDEFYSEIGWELVHFIGFNALNECEKTVMRRLQKAGKARFYWDFDNSYVTGGRFNSAGYFMRENIRLFGNDMPSGWNYDTMLSAATNEVSRRVIETSSDVAQVKLIPELVRQLTGLTRENAHHTAIVLADENLLMPVLTSLPENNIDINISMGYPLKHTQVYTLIRHLMDLQRDATGAGDMVRFDHTDVISILKHSLIADLMAGADNDISGEIISGNIIQVSPDRFSHAPYLKLIFDKPSTPAALSGYFKDILSLVASGRAKKNDDSAIDNVAENIRNEFIYRIILSINRLEAIVMSGEVSFTAATYMRILDKMLRIQSVPFSGEPLSGIQVMGILETRALDFRNLIILSVNEGNLPSFSSGSSVIPFSLREAFGLPSINHQESVYAYHFYRLLQRAENVTFLYNSNSEGLRNGEMSRFLVQMKYDKIMKPVFMDLGFEIKSHISPGETVEKTEEHIRQLISRFLDKEKKRILSPSAINMWLFCRMKFYYRYVNGLKEPETVTSDIDPAMLGEILHDVMKELYSGFINKTVTPGILDQLVRDKYLLESVILNKISERFSNAKEREIEGNELIIREVLMAYILKILAADRSVAPFTILHLEAGFDFPLVISSGNKETEVLTGGIIDRIDIKDGITRIVDYKTGSVSERITSIDSLFESDRKKDNDAWLQTLLYCEAYLDRNKDVVVGPSVYTVRKMTGSEDTGRLKIRAGRGNETVVDDFRVVRDSFISKLKETIAGIFSPDEPFVMTSDIRGKCSYCPYRGLCNR